VVVCCSILQFDAGFGDAADLVGFEGCFGGGEGGVVVVAVKM
jgi:hypothetical protein